MGSEKLEQGTTKAQEGIEDSYIIKTYLSAQLPEDFKNLIIAPFLNSLRYGNDLFKLIDKDAYYPVYTRYVESLLKRDISVVKIAMLRDKTALGWSLFEGKTLHYIWVKKEVRRQGIAKSLMPTEIDTITHITNKGLNIWVSKFPQTRFNPFV